MLSLNDLKTFRTTDSVSIVRVSQSGCNWHLGAENIFVEGKRPVLCGTWSSVPRLYY